MTDVVGKLWGFCHVLRHEGIDYGDYIEQLTYLLFLKMADERGIELPVYKDTDPTSGAVIERPCDWPYLRKQSGTDLTEHYQKLLSELGRQNGILGDIFSGSQSRFTNPVSLQRLIHMIDETEWTAIDTDIKAAVFEGLLEKAASEGKKGAGQYFTPRLLIESIVRCVKPDPRVDRDFKIDDPACGTGGFLVAAYDWLKGQTKGGALERDLAQRIRARTYFGQELVARPRRLALMNLYLHQVEPHISLTDSIYETPSPERYDVVLTNPPFGTKGANQAPDREDFVVQTSNKQLNFIQHVLTILSPGGRAAIVVPDNVLFANQAAEVFQVLMEDCDVHSVLRCPRGTFSPYTEGTKTNVIFFTKGRSTERTWIYDARANVPKITKKSRPLTKRHFSEFEACYGDDPNGLSKRAEADSPDGRWRSFSLDEIKERHYKLDAFKWLRDEETDDLGELPEPEELITEAMEALQLALDDLGDIQSVLETTGGET
jgi:type I restriction enzyme M protein